MLLLTDHHLQGDWLQLDLSLTNGTLVASAVALRVPVPMQKIRRGLWPRNLGTIVIVLAVVFRYAIQAITMFEVGKLTVNWGQTRAVWARLVCP
jgi:hypothetical protein